MPGSIVAPPTLAACRLYRRRPWRPVQLKWKNGHMLAATILASELDEPTGSRRYKRLALCL
jgi:hypothetical protein